MTTEHPLLIDTAGGVMGATVTVPTGRPRAALVFIPGANDDRSLPAGAPRRLASEIADDRIITLRPDTPGTGDSFLSKLM